MIPRKALLLTTFALLCGCEQPSEQSTILAAATRYEREFVRVSDRAAWAPTMCAPPRRAPLVSRSTDDATHGGKLYLLFTNQPDWYLSLSNDAAATAHEAIVTSEPPRGATLVKESWTPAESSAEDTHGSPTAEKDGVRYTLGERRELFLMRYEGPDAPGTDAGWTYAVTTPDGARVLSAGMISSCVACHARAPHGRVFGLQAP